MAKKEQNLKYLVRPMIKDGNIMKNKYEVTKYKAGGVWDETYAVETVPIIEGGFRLWCSCLGFRRQKYPHEQHKHILLAMDYRARGAPRAGIYYRLEGTGQHAIVHFDHESGECSG